MKTMILTAALVISSFGAFARGDDKYCAKLKDGRMVVMYKGSPLTTNATLDNGAVVKPDGTVMMKDGTSLLLSDGECIHKDGTTGMKKDKDLKKS